MTQLDTCPFCNAKADLQKDPDPDSGEYCWFIQIIHKSTCPISCEDMMWNTAEEAGLAWNTRTDDFFEGDTRYGPPRSCDRSRDDGFWAKYAFARGC